MSERFPKADLYNYAKRYLLELNDWTSGVPGSDFAANLDELWQALELPDDARKPVEDFLGGGLEQDGYAFVNWGPNMGQVSLTDLGADDIGDGFCLSQTVPSDRG